MLALLLALACAADAPPADTGPAARGTPMPATIRDRCFPGIGDAEAGFPAYDQYGVVVPDHCMGTDHQEVDRIEKLVFLGDSITAGTPPTPEDEYYRNALATMLDARYGPGLEIVDCSEYGARTDDLLLHSDRGLNLCFPEGVEDRRTLIVMTIGGNDMFAAAEDVATQGEAAAVTTVSQAITYLDEALAWIREGADLDGPTPEVSDRFPNGVFVAYSNVYEYTDATGDLGSCPAAEILGFDYAVPQLRDGYIWISEAFLELSVRYHMDAILMLEHFCGHGFRADDPEGECYRGPDTEPWFDGTCIHPNPAGHRQIAEMFYWTITDEAPPE